jgi:hypothetical protein
MILRSVTKHVKEQNWFAVFVDLLIVVVGVFIGIQVSNWNEEIAGKKQAGVLLNRLYEDLNNEQKAFNSSLKYRAIVRNYAMTAIDALNGEKTVSDEAFVIGAYQASQIGRINSYRATYSEMLSTGQINLIKNEQLKSMIFGYYAEDVTNSRSLSEPSLYRKFIRGLMPIAVQNAIKLACGDKVVEVGQSFGYTLPTSCDLQFPDKAISETASLLRSNPDMLNNLQYQITVNEAETFIITSFEQEIHKVMVAIKEHLP